LVKRHYGIFFFAAVIISFMRSDPPNITASNITAVEEYGSMSEEGLLSSY